MGYNRVMKAMTRPLLPALILSALLLGAAPARSAEILLEPSAVLKLLTQALFTREGKYDLRAGKCYAYLESPSVALKDGRVSIRSHLASRTGVEVQGACVGINLVSWTVVSGAPVARGGVVRLEDIRIDQVDDPTARLVVESGLLPSLPGAVDLDVQQAVAGLLKDPKLALQAQVEAFNFDSVGVVDQKLRLRFDFRLVAR